MPAEVLVMCTQCGRPQHAGKGTCVSCGAALPPPSEIVPRSGRDELLDAFQPYFEADLGRGRKILLSKKRIELLDSEQARAVQIDLSELRGARLDARPVFESLIFTGAAVALFAWARNWVPRLALGALAVLTAAACVLQRRFFLRLENQEGQVIRFALGIGRGEQAARIRAIYESLEQELRSLGVAVGRG